MAEQRPLPASAAAPQGTPPPPSKEGAQKICVVFAWTSRARHASRALSPMNMAWPCFLEKAKSLQWSQQQQNAGCEEWAGSCWILARCFPTHTGFCTNIPSKLVRRGRGWLIKTAANALSSSRDSWWDLAVLENPLRGGSEVTQLRGRTDADAPAHSPQQAAHADGGTMPKHRAS